MEKVMNARKRADKYQRTLDYGDLMRDQINDYADHIDERIKTMDNCDPAMIGITEFNHAPVVVYDYNLLVSLLMVRDNMTFEEAVEFVDYNLRPQQGKGYPVILERDPSTTALGPAKKNPTVKRQLTSDQLELAL
jgi:hypothetical protein